MIACFIKVVKLTKAQPLVLEINYTVMHVGNKLSYPVPERDNETTQQSQLVGGKPVGYLQNYCETTDYFS